MEAEADALARWLAVEAGAASARVEALAKLSGGAIQENWALDAAFDGGPFAGRQHLVVRTDAPSAVAASRGRAEEFALFKAAHQAGVTVPEPLWLCTDPGITGRPFFVMRRVAGTGAGHRLVKDDALIPDRPALLRGLGVELARIHTIRPPRADLAFLGAPPQAPALAAIAGFRAWLDRQETAYPVLEWGLRWLERNAPVPERIVLNHNDFRTGNYMVADGRVSGVLDWEFAGWGDPLADIGWLFAPCWRFGARARVAGGVGEPEDFLAGYEAESGTRVDRARLPYWIAFATLRWAVIALQQANRHVRGGETSLELALTAHVVPDLELDLLEMTREP